MTKQIATHKVIHYESLVTGTKTISSTLKFLALKKSIKGLLERGRAVIAVNYAEARNPIGDFVVGSFAFEAVYLGRKAVNHKGIRHKLRSAHKEFVSQSISIPYN